MLIGLLAGVFWALDTVIIGTVIQVGNENLREVLLNPIIAGGIHDIFAAVWIFMYLKCKNKLSSVYEKIKTKSGSVVILAALLGGPIGMTCYVSAINHIGAGYTAVISSTFPAVGAVMAWLFLKEYMSIMQIVGTVLCILGIMSMGYLPYIGISESVSLIGVLYAVLCCFSWASEAVICSWGMKNNVIDEEIALLIREWSSAIMYVILICSMFREELFFIYNNFEGTSFLYIFLASMFGILSYLCYYRTIRNKGVCTGMVLDVTYSVWAIIFSSFIFNSKTTVWGNILSVIIIIGSILSVKRNNINS
ncbi:MAG: DMT family transporter [Selenomonadaceae bacterium]|nr:DMT family transporter [Selenomonadaceae bacterium]